MCVEISFQGKNRGKVRGKEDETLTKTSYFLNERTLKSGREGKLLRVRLSLVKFKFY